MGESVGQIHLIAARSRNVHRFDRTYDMLAESRKTRDEFNRRARLVAFTHAPILIDDRINLSGLRIHHNDRSGATRCGERVDGDATDFHVFADRLIMRDVLHRLVMQVLIESALACDGLLAGDFAAARLFLLTTEFGETFAARHATAAARRRTSADFDDLFDDLITTAPDDAARHDALACALAPR